MHLRVFWWGGGEESWGGISPAVQTITHLYSSQTRVCSMPVLLVHDVTRSQLKPAQLGQDYSCDKGRGLWH